MADIEANRALAEAYIAKQLGFRAEELRNKLQTLTPPPIAEVRFKRYKNQVDDKVRASALVAQRAAAAVVRSIGESAPPFLGCRDAGEIREAILRRSEYVDLESLLESCWRSGIPVLQLAQVPAGGKRFDGMAAFVEERPVIILASGRDGAPWLAFYLAHEIGHIMLGHVQPDTEALVDGTIAGEAGASGHEREADQFACELLSGFPEPKIRNLKAAAPRLAVIAAGKGPEQGVDPGVFTLIYAKSNNRWGVGQNALKYLKLDTGGQAMIAEFLNKHLSQVDLSEADERFLNVLDIT